MKKINLMLLLSILMFALPIHQATTVLAKTNTIIENVDVLVDGPFVESKKDLTLKFRGSSIQRILTKDQIKELYK